MNLTPDKELEIYGKVPSGEESDLELAKLQRGQYLKGKLRTKLDFIPLGDTKDNLTDLIKGTLLGWAIQQGIVKDAEIIARFNVSVKAQLEFYGGAAYVMTMLEDNAMKLAAVMARYYQAKAEIEAAEDVEAVTLVDIE